VRNQPDIEVGLAGLPASIPIVAGQRARSAWPEAMAIENGDPARGAACRDLARLANVDRAWVEIVPSFSL
jgi:hypothetical protein